MSVLKQGTWMVVATTLAGVCMFGVHGFAPWLGAASYGLMVTLLNLVNFALIPAPGLQTVFAHETAAIGNDHARRRLAGNVVGVLLLLTGLWLGVAFLVVLNQNAVLHWLKITDPRVVWMTLAVILPHLWLPVLMGVVQGRQRFGWLGGAVLSNGMGRFLMVGAVLLWVGAELPWILVGALTGALCALGCCVAACGQLWSFGFERMEWRAWLWRALPLAVGPAIYQFMLTADMIAARVRFDEISSGYYGAAGLVGRGLVMFVGPIAGVMFPKLVRESQGRTGRRLVSGTALATALLAVLVIGLAVLGGWFIRWQLAVEGGFTWLPEGARAAVFAKEEKLRWASGVIPWFLGGMGCLAMANVYISHLVANLRFRAMLSLLWIPLGYAAGLYWLSYSPRQLVLWMVVGNGVLLLAAWWQSRQAWGLATKSTDEKTA